jgi:hypothetical protein
LPCVNPEVRQRLVDLAAGQAEGKLDLVVREADAPVVVLARYGLEFVERQQVLITGLVHQKHIARLTADGRLVLVLGDVAGGDAGDIGLCFERVDVRRDQ